MALISENNECDAPLTLKNTKNTKYSKLKAVLLPKMQEYVYYSHLFLTLALLTFIILRVFWIISEYSYISKTTLPISKDCWAIFKHVFHFNVTTWLLIVIVLLALALFWHSPSHKDFRQNLSSPMILGYTLVLCIVYFSQLDDSRFNNRMHIRQSNLLDYGSGMAYSYYHGYLEIIGPTHGDERKGITERLENYEDTEEVTIPVKRLFIIIPINSYIPTVLSEGTNGKLNASKSLPQLVIDRAGVKSRSYANMVYRISGRDKWYVCAEGATPVLTLNEALKFEPNLEYLKEEILIKFYHTLKNIINKHEKTQNKFEVILYNHNENLGDVLERRIKEILNENNH